MRSEEEMLNLILQFANQDDTILAVTMNGSRANRDCIRDKYSDFDIQYIVGDIKPFIKNKKWMEFFGDILIAQEPADWFSHPYDMESKDQYPFLMQFTDGNRIDLVFVHKEKMEQFNNEVEPRKILLNKNNKVKIKEIISTEAFNIAKPTEKEFHDVVNEFLWLSLYVFKGIKRKELCFAKRFMDIDEIGLICKMISWKIGIDTGFSVSLGKSYKNIKRYLNEKEMERFSGIYPNGRYVDIYEKLLYAIDYFEENAVCVAKKLGFQIDIHQIDNIRNYLRKNDVGQEGINGKDG